MYLSLTIIVAVLIIAFAESCSFITSSNFFPSILVGKGARNTVYKGNNTQLVARYLLYARESETVQRSIYDSIRLRLKEEEEWEDDHIKDFRQLINVLAETSSEELMIVSSKDSLDHDFNTGVQLRSSEGLVFNIIPVIHRACIDMNDHWLKEKIPETHQHLGLHVEYMPACAGTIADVVNWKTSSSMKLLFGYFNDMFQMHANFGNYYCDGHPGNILVNMTVNNSLQFFWADPGRTDSEKRFAEDKKNYPEITDSLSFQFLRSVELLFNFMEEKWAKLEDAILIVKKTRHHHINLMLDQTVIPGTYFSSILNHIQLAIEENLSQEDFKYFLEELHPSSKFSESVLSKRLNAIELKLKNQDAIELKLKNQDAQIKNQDAQIAALWRHINQTLEYVVS